MVDILDMHISRHDLQYFPQVLANKQMSIALETKNCISTIQLRNIIYVHNQLVSYGEKIYIKGFLNDMMRGAAEDEQ